LVDFHGNEIWRTPYDPSASTSGDIDGDGVVEFFFAGRDSSIEARIVAGKVIWHTSVGSMAFKMGFLQADSVETAQVLADTGELIGIGPNGQILFRHHVPLDRPLMDFFVTTWPRICDGQCLLVSKDDGFRLFSRDGLKNVASLPGRYLAEARSVPVRLFGNEPPLLAVAGLLEYQGKQFAGFEAVHSELYIFDSNRNLIYDEVLPEPVGALGVLPANDGKSETLLVGGENKIWQYSAKTPTSQSSVNP
jgi:hypothetical protein